MQECRVQDYFEFFFLFFEMDYFELSFSDPLLSLKSSDGKNMVFKSSATTFPIIKMRAMLDLHRVST
jgi:hypothetical protein